MRTINIILLHSCLNCLIATNILISNETMLDSNTSKNTSKRDDSLNDRNSSLLSAISRSSALISGIKKMCSEKKKRLIVTSPLSPLTPRQAFKSAENTSWPNVPALTITKFARISKTISSNDYEIYRTNNYPTARWNTVGSIFMRDTSYIYFHSALNILDAEYARKLKTIFFPCNAHDLFAILFLNAQETISSNIQNLLETSPQVHHNINEYINFSSLDILLYRYSPNDICQSKIAHTIDSNFLLLGVSLLKTNAVKKQEEGLSYVLLAAKQGVPIAQKIILSLYLQNEFSNGFLTLFGESILSKLPTITLEKWVSNLLKKNNHSSEFYFNIAFLFEYGILFQYGNTYRRNEAYKYYQLSSSLGNKNASFRLGLLYMYNNKHIVNRYHHSNLLLDYLIKSVQKGAPYLQVVLDRYGINYSNPQTA